MFLHECRNSQRDKVSRCVRNKGKIATNHYLPFQGALARAQNRRLKTPALICTFLNSSSLFNTKEMTSCSVEKLSELLTSVYDGMGKETRGKGIIFHRNCMGSRGLDHRVSCKQMAYTALTQICPNREQ